MTPCEEILAFMDRLGIKYDLIRHEPVWAFDDYAPLGKKLSAVVLKNLLLTTRRRGGLYMYVSLPDVPFRAGIISAQAGASRLCMAPEEALSARLRTFSGALSPLALIFDADRQVRLLLDRGVMAHDRLAFHPAVNDTTVALRREDFLRIFLPAIGHEAEIVDSGRDG